MILGDLLARWRTEAELFERRGLHEAAELTYSLSDELEAEVRELREGTVNLTEGAKLSGYSADTLGQMVRDGRIPNAGRKNAPRIRLVDLPRKPGCGEGDSSVPVLSLSDGGASGSEDSGSGGRLRVQGRDRST